MRLGDRGIYLTENRERLFRFAVREKPSWRFRQACTEPEREQSRDAARSENPPPGLWGRQQQEERKPCDHCKQRADPPERTDPRPQPAAKICRGELGHVRGAEGEIASQADAEAEPEQDQPPYPRRDPGQRGEDHEKRDVHEKQELSSEAIGEITEQDASDRAPGVSGGEEGGNLSRARSECRHDADQRNRDHGIVETVKEGAKTGEKADLPVQLPHARMIELTEDDGVDGGYRTPPWNIISPEPSTQAACEPR